jgi:hypothetical protein
MINLKIDLILKLQYSYNANKYNKKMKSNMQIIKSRKVLINPLIALQYFYIKL